MRKSEKYLVREQSGKKIIQRKKHFFKNNFYLILGADFRYCTSHFGMNSCINAHYIILHMVVTRLIIFEQAISILFLLSKYNSIFSLFQADL